MKQILWVWHHIKPKYRIIYIVCMVLSALLSVLVLVNPLIIKFIIDNVVVPITQDPSRASALKSELVEYLLIMIGFTVLRTGIGYATGMMYERVSQKFVFKMKKDVFALLQKQDAYFFAQNKTGDIMTRMTSDLDMMRHTISYVIRAIIDSTFLFIPTAIYMFSKNWQLTVALLLVTPILYVLMNAFRQEVRPMYREMRERLSTLNTNAQENISGNKVIKALAQEGQVKEVFNTKNIEYKDANIRASFTWLRYFPWVESLSQSMSITMLLVGGYFLLNGSISVGTFFAFNGLTWVLSNPMRMIGVLLNEFQRFLVSADRVISLHDAEVSIVNKENAFEATERLKGKIEFKKVNLVLNDVHVLKDIDLTIEPGQTVAIMGSTGAGKTVLVNCITRFCDISSGELLIDGRSVSDYTLTSLRKNIGIASQDVFLFSDTIDGNIAYGDLNLRPEEVVEFAKLSASHFIERTPEGYETLIGERGVGLSGGQRQRLALARALAVRPAILILDDTTSAVDLETELEIQHNLQNLDFPCTKIIIAQRVSSTKKADRIVVLDRGHIIETGTHAELIAKKGYYHEIYKLQNDGPEADEEGKQ